MRIASTLAVAAVAGLLWAGACLAIGLPLGFVVAGAVLGTAGGFLAAAICRIGGTADHIELEQLEARRTAIVALAGDERFSREGTPSPTKDRVA